MCRTFSKIHGLAALRLGWMFAPGAHRRRRQSHPRPVQCQPRLRSRRHRRDRGHRASGTLARAQHALARLADRGDRQARPDGDAERRQFPADPFSRNQGPHRQGRRRVPDRARADPALVDRLQIAECAAPERRHRGGQPSGRRCAQGFHGESRVMLDQARPHLQPPGADRRRPDRLLDRACGARARRGARDRGDRTFGGDAAARRRARARRPGGRNQCRGGGGRRPRHRLRAGRRLRRGREGDRPASQSRARSSPTSARSRRAIVRDMGPHLPAGVHFVPAHPVAGTENSGPDAGFAELFVGRWCILTPPRRRRAGSGRAARRVLARARRQCRNHVAGASRPGAGDHQPCAASDRLHHRRHRRRAWQRSPAPKC